MDNGNRNYIQKIPPKDRIPAAGTVRYNCSIIWEAERINPRDYKKRFESINVLSFKRDHLNILGNWK